MIITLTNETKRDVDFYPKCELMTDTFQVIPAGKGVASVVFEKIKERHKNTYPFLKYINDADNKLLQGEDNACDLAIIWEDFDNKAQNVKLFITYSLLLIIFVSNGNVFLNINLALMRFSIGRV